MSPRPHARASDPFRALADPTRRGIIELLWKRRVCSAGEIADRFRNISRPAVSRHLKVLRQARLVRAKGIGREHRYQVDGTALARMQRDWFAQFTSIWGTSLAALKQQVESGNTK
jgi:DNA-binding transcriptional ArsR family regulator